MSDPPPKPAEKVQQTAATLLETAARCYRLAQGITDRQTIARLLEMAQECEEREEAIKRARG